ncbi:Rfu1p NDAI_0G01710 [Naumovozyma dairenensis CBS 421]|uniref:Regulator of free ubiquitin chains 1 n=1 Tax=Naumovozyma dairenensis (strain ATCC 10597 / BCRC 20456 / CBS 421 / NBRC 0211 / NRRL Y-12639) TaxID=1071378 RepID=G0WDT6_NAUDC|nr:hypothetical protein NDAI_0G01710 [Naumovozyma dairenensis CBS 421]CCD25947.2 hypothetical protein NDAI_0G01710 [Naumovozyma dairenensis CBS 421]
MKSTTQLAAEARDYKFNPAIPLRIYLKTCVNILNKAQTAFQSRDLSLAYTFYFRYVDLCTNKLSKHPEFIISSNGNSESMELSLYRQEYLQLIKLEVPAVLRIIEDLQRQIDLQYNQHQLSLAKNIAKPMHHHHHQIRRNSIEGGEECTARQRQLLPPTFNESRFNQSISFLRETSLSLNKNKSQNHNTLEEDRDGKPILHYPELPQLSFPTF